MKKNPIQGVKKILKPGVYNLSGAEKILLIKFVDNNIYMANGLPFA